MSRVLSTPSSPALLGASANLPQARQPANQERRPFGDALATRKLIFSNALGAVQGLQHYSNARHELQLVKPYYADEKDYALAEQKAAILEGRSLGRRLRGTWRLLDKETGQVLDKRKQTIATIPWFTPRGTIIHNGSEYVLNNQMRLRPGIFTRVKDSGEIESHVNIAPGKGKSHRMFLDPEKGVFYARIDQAKIPLLPLLRAMGAQDSQLREAWGPELLAANMQNDSPAALNKYYERLLRRVPALDDEEDRKAALLEVISRMELDPEVTKRTLGKSYDRLSLDAILDTTRKLLAVSRGEATVDDRDHLAFQTIHGPEDLIAERLAKDHGGLRRKLFARASWSGNLKRVPANALNKQVQAALLHSGLGLNIEEVNPLDAYDKQSRITRLGEGGIGSLDAVPEDARSVQPSHLDFLDPLRTPESLRAGIDTHIASTVQKGDHGKIYSPFIHPRSGKTIFKSPQDVADLAVAFPGQMDKPGKRVWAIKDGQIQAVLKSKVDLVVPHMENVFSPLANMIPLKSMTKGQRVVMGSRMLSQALPVINPEAPLVQSGIPGKPGESYESSLGTYAGALRADRGGRVLAVEPGKISVRYDNGKQEEIELYSSFPYNRKTFIHQTSLVQPGSRFKQGQVLARSNYTDDSGAAALGKNARVAYTAFRGKNFEDAIVISRSFAERMASEHAFQHRLDKSDDQKLGQNSFVSLFPSKYDRSVLETMDQDGVVTTGTKVQFDSPLILAARVNRPGHHKVHRKGGKSFSDATVTWKHQQPGVVTDVAKTDKGITVLVKSTMPMLLGDKLSGRFGGKGVIGDIVEDEQMPHDRAGNAFEVLLNPLGVHTRCNPSQMVEAALGKLAKKLGKPYIVDDFGDIEDWTEFAIRELQSHGLSDTESIYDPETSRRIDDVFTGNRFFMKLHHTAAGKGQGRGTGGYTSEDAPARGGEAGSKKLGVMDVNALLSHGSTRVLQDASGVRGQRNEDYWLAFMQGHNPPKPRVPLVFQKFVEELKASGINVVQDGPQLNIMALTNKDVKQLAGDREIKSGETVRFERGLQPIPGGLFDPKLTGGHQGSRWASVRLNEPMPSPVMEEPIRRILGLTKNQFEKVLSGEEQITVGDMKQTGPSAIAKALDSINLKRELAVARAQIAGSRKTARDQAIRKLGYLKSAEVLGIHPREWVLDRVPVLPPRFRPISVMQDNKRPLVADANYLYKELIDANDNLREMAKEVDDIGEERLNLYRAFKAVTGLGDPLHPKLRERRVTGLLKGIFGSAPKYGTVQRRLLSSSTDLVGRAVITPNPDLDMDSVGLPENRAWDVYEKFIVRRLHRRGMPILQAVNQVRQRTPQAREELLNEMAYRPVFMNRAPVLHRFGIMSFWPRLTKGDVVQVSPLVVKGFNADFDGNCLVSTAKVAIDFDLGLLSTSSMGREFLNQLKEQVMLTAGTRLWQDHDTFRLVMSIGEFPVVGQPVRDCKGADVYRVPEGITLCSYDHATGNVIRGLVRRFTVDRNHPCVQVVTARGRRVEVSNNESLAVFDHKTGRLIKQVPDAAGGQWLPVVVREPIPGKQYGRDIGWWYGALVADGWVQPRMIGYSKNDELRLQEFERVARETINPNFSRYRYDEPKKLANKYGTSRKIHLNGVQLVRSVFSVYAEEKESEEAQGLRAALYKRIPIELLSYGSQKCLLGLFSGLLDGDCSVGVNHSSKRPRLFCRFNTSSPWLVEGLHQLGRYLNVRMSVTVVAARGVSREAYIVSPSLPDLAKLAPLLSPVSQEVQDWLQQLQTNSFEKDNIDVIPVTKEEAEAGSILAREHDEFTLYTICRKAITAGTIGRSSLRRVLALERDSMLGESLRQRVENTAVHWDRVKRVVKIASQDVFDFEVVGTKVFAINNGLVVYDTSQYHVPVGEEARQEAVEQMMPSHNLLSPADFETPVHMPTQEYTGGLYAATAKSKKKQRPHRFASKKDAIQAYMRGNINIDTPVEIVE